jgi:ketosteroid isomerase-like protein
MGADDAPPRYIVSLVLHAWMHRELTEGTSRWILACGGRTIMTIEDLDTFFTEGWNGHDVERLMTFMTDDCVFESAAGSEVCGTRHAGREHVRAAFTRILSSFPDVAFHDTRHFVAGDRGVSEWRFTGTTAAGTTVEVDGCDVFMFRGAKIALKSSFLKNRVAA